jgi:vancomycin resistance protein YoaR
MKHIEIKVLLKSEVIVNIVILAVSIALIYSLISAYFCYHFFFNTEINGVNVSLKSHGSADQMIRDHIKGFKLRLTERNSKTEEIAGQDINLKYNENLGSKIYHIQNSYDWISSLFEDKKYYINNLYTYDKDLLKNKIDELNCSKENATEPKNVSFKYENGSYETMSEVYGNAIVTDKFIEAIKTSIEKGVTNLDLEVSNCYKSPKYTLNSLETNRTKSLLNQYVSTSITYEFGTQNEILDGSTINRWLRVDEKLEVVINKTAIMNFIKELSRKYNTVGIAREFKTSTGKTISIIGGLYGWKIDQDAESEVLYENITRGDVMKKEPIYAQKALLMGESDIGNTYVEVNITKQHIWFYMDGKLITDGPVVTGNPNRGWSTITGTYMLNYKQKGATLSGPGYITTVTYWMPFYGNIGIHDASWRYSFGGEIYKEKGTHGCINAPFYLAKTIFENIKEGTPILCFEE